MKQEDLEMLVTDLCERFPHTIYASLNDQDMRIIDISYARGEVVFTLVSDTKTFLGVEGDRIRPYLHPIENMTPEDREEYESTFETIELADGFKLTYPSERSHVFLIKKHYDTRGLIKLGLAKVAPDWMYRE